MYSQASRGLPLCQPVAGIFAVYRMRNAMASPPTGEQRDSLSVGLLPGSWHEIDVQPCKSLSDLVAAGDPQLPVEPIGMSFHSANGRSELLGDLSVRVAFEQKSADFSFSFRQFDQLNRSDCCQRHTASMFETFLRQLHATRGNVRSRRSLFLGDLQQTAESFSRKAFPTAPRKRNS